MCPVFGFRFLFLRFWVIFDKGGPFLSKKGRNQSKIALVRQKKTQNLGNRGLNPKTGHI